MTLSTEALEALLCAAAASWGSEIVTANPAHQPGWAVDQIPPPCIAVLTDLWVSGQREQLQLLWNELVEHCARAGTERRIAITAWDLAAGLRDALPVDCDDYSLSSFLLSAGDRSHPRTGTWRPGSGMSCSPVVMTGN